MDGQQEAGEADLAQGRIESAGPAAEAGPAVAERRVLREIAAGVSEPRLGVRLCGRPDARGQGVPDADNHRRVHPGVPGDYRGPKDQLP